MFICCLFCTNSPTVYCGKREVFSSHLQLCLESLIVPRRQISHKKIVIVLFFNLRHLFGATLKTLKSDLILLQEICSACRLNEMAAGGKLSSEFTFQENDAGKLKFHKFHLQFAQTASNS